MLILSRKKDESIVINGEIWIKVIELMGNSVRLGITAPKNVPIHRLEVEETITLAQAKALKKKG